MQALFRATLPLTLQASDDLVGCAESSTIGELRAQYEGRRALVVGGTRGIGLAITDALMSAGASVVTVGRSAQPPSGVSADLSTVSGCKDLVKRIAQMACQFTYVVFTVGAWPNFASPLTSDGVDGVVALDLVARHLVSNGLFETGCLEEGCRVMCVLASGQRLPSSLINRESVCSFLEGSAPNKAGELPPVRSRLDQMTNMLSTAVLHDAWLQHAAHVLPPSVRLLSTFPGLLVSDLPQHTLYAWALPLFKLAMLPVADSADTMGLQHATILAAPNVERRRVSFWAAPLLQVRTNLPPKSKPHPGPP